MIEQREPHWSVARSLQHSLLAPAEARSFVVERICRRHDPLAIGATALVASELVTQAVRTGEGPIRIALQCQVSTLTLSVTCSMEGSSETSALRLADPIAGMIVDSVCRSTGSLATGDDVTLWATISTGYLPAHVSVPDVPQQAADTGRLQQSEMPGR